MTWSIPRSRHRGASLGRRKLAPIQKLRAKYSVGVIVIFAAAAPKNFASAALAVVMRP